MTLRKIITNILCGTVKKFSPMRKNDLKKGLPELPLRNFFFMFILLISNQTVFLVQFGINLHLRVFQKAAIALVKVARAISAF